MKFAFSTFVCPSWDAATVVANAKSYGYDGVELGAGGACDPLAGGSGELGGVFAGGGVEIACVATDLALPANDSEREARTDAVKRAIDAAAGLKCPRVRILDAELRSGMTLSVLGLHLRRWLEELGDLACDRGIELVVENALSFRKARDLWLALDTMCHANVGACWDGLSAAMAGESPWVSVPTLNAKIRYVRLRDAKIAGGTATATALGEGDAAARTLITRLMGIGYRGYVTVGGGQGPAEAMLPAALAKLKDWTAPPTAPVKATPPKPAAGKIAAKVVVNVPKPAVKPADKAPESDAAPAGG